jgi:2'-5' RNA ligase
MMSLLRAFIAIEMPDPVVDIVRRSQQALQRGGIHLRWVRPENVHLTLRFLGDIPTDAIDGIRTALEDLADKMPSFSLRVKGAGAFPGVSRPRAVWLGLDGQTHMLMELHQRLSSLLSRQGIPEEKRPFRGHLTIGRAKGRMDTERLKRQLGEMKGIETPTFTVDRISLIRSELGPGGAVYTPLVQVRTQCC